MPVYQYACTECGEQLEVRQSFTDDALTECPACAGRLRKVLSAVGVVFKGSGFYRNDSRAAAADGTRGDGSGDGSGASGDGASGDKDGNREKGDKDGNREKGDTGDKPKKDDKPSPQTTGPSTSSPAGSGSGTAGSRTRPTSSTAKAAAG